MADGSGSEGGAQIRARQGGDGVLTLVVEGRLDAGTTGAIWRRAGEIIRQAGPSPILLDASSLDYCDISGIGFILDLRRRQRQAERPFEVQGLSAEIARLLGLFEGRSIDGGPKPRAHASLPEQVGRASVELWGAVRDLVAFLGHLVVSLARVAIRRKQVRWKDTFIVAEAAL